MPSKQPTESVCESVRERTYSMAEHEILLAFNGDSDAALFDEWWNTAGEAAFLEWRSRELEASDDD